ncbi:hypothetical protein ACOMHN_020502 [Nucella lapillus]
MGQPSKPGISPDSDSTLDMNSFVDNTSSPFTLPPPLFIPCDNPRNVVSPFIAEMVDLVVYVGIFPVLVTCGVITNVINMVVFARQGLSHRINMWLFSLAVSDTGSLVFMMGGKSYALISLVDPVAGNYWKQRHVAAVLGSYLAFVAISNAAKFFRTKYMVMLIVVVATYILMVKNTALLTKYETVQVTDPVTNVSTFVNRISPLYNKMWDWVTLYSISVGLCLLSLLTVVVCTTAIILRLKVTATWRRSSATNIMSVEKQEAAMNRMLVTVCCVYAMCMTPSAMRSLLINVVHGFQSSGHLCNLYRDSTSFIRLLEAFNASVNFLIYVNHSSQYRSTLRLLFYRDNQQINKVSVSTSQLD